MRQTFAVYCGARLGTSPAYAQAMQALAQAIAARGGSVVYGGGRVGLMGVLADAALAAGAKVIGVIPRALYSHELAHTGLTELHVVETMHERKAKMAQLCDSFIAAPGGFGTFDELFEAITWTQLGFQSKPVALFDVEQFYKPLQVMIQNMCTNGFISEEHASSIVIDSDPAQLLDRLTTIDVPLPRHEVRNAKHESMQ